MIWGVVGGSHNFHELVEGYYEKTNPLRMHAEYGLHKGVGNYEYAVDLMYFVPFRQDSEFVFDSLAFGEVYEIEPIDLAYSSGHGIDQANGYIDLLRRDASLGKLQGQVKDLTGLYQGRPYDWNAVTWRLGNSIEPTVHSIAIQPVATRKLIFWKQESGLIIYVDTNSEEQLKELMANEKYKAVRYLIAVETPQAFANYKEQLRQEATACYADLNSEFWDPNHISGWEWFWETYWGARTRHNVICIELGICVAP